MLASNPNLTKCPFFPTRYVPISRSFHITCSVSQLQSAAEVVNGRVPERNEIRLGLPSKGRMAADTLDLLKDCQLSVKHVNPRQYVAQIPQVPSLSFKFFIFYLLFIYFWKKELKSSSPWIFTAAFGFGSVVSTAQRHCTEIVVWRLRPWHSRFWYRQRIWAGNHHLNILFIQFIGFRVCSCICNWDLGCTIVNVVGFYSAL